MDPVYILANVVILLLLGTGKRVFAEGAPAQKFELVRTTTTPLGVMVTTYKVAGELKVE